MNQDNNNLVFTTEQLEILPNIKYMCFDVYITTDNQVYSLKLKPRKEKLIGGSYCYYVNGQYRTKKWIQKKCINVQGCVFE